MLRAPCSF